MIGLVRVGNAARQQALPDGDRKHHTYLLVFYSDAKRRSSLKEESEKRAQSRAKETLRGKFLYNLSWNPPAETVAWRFGTFECL